MKIYVASSWKNPFLDEVVLRLKEEGHEVFDFREHTKFGWSQVDPEYKTWTRQNFVQGLQTPRAREAFWSDMEGLNSADAVVCVLPSNRSAHLELGFGVAAGKLTAVLLLEEPVTAELMYGMVDMVTPDLDKLCAWLGHAKVDGMKMTFWRELNTQR